MSIGNDIKPRKVYYPRKHNSRSDSASSELFEDQDKEEHKQKKHEEEKDNEKILIPEEAAPESKDIEAMQDEFFQSYNKPMPKADEEPHARIIRIGPGKIIVTMFAIVIIILVVQNLSSIKNFLIPQKAAIKTQSTNTNNVNEEYTAISDANSNTNSINEDNTINTNANINTNTNTAATTNQNSNSTATTNSEISKSTIALKVLNGNGVSGTAAVVADQLRAAGFTIQSVTNAKSFIYSSTIVYYKTGKESEATLVKNSITGRIISIEKSDSAVGALDVVVVVGKK